MRRPIGIAILVVVTVAVGACTFSPKKGGVSGAAGSGAGGTTPTGGAGAGGTAPPIPGLASLRVDPPTAAVSVQPGKPAMQMFRAFGKVGGGAEQDVTAMVSWSVDRPMLVPSIAGGLATTGDTAGGVVQVRASSASVSANATLTI